MPLRIGIVGGGAAGLASLKVILDTKEYQAGEWIPFLYEARDDIGGIWLPAEPTNAPPLTPLYDSLTTNLPHPVMAFQTLPFPPETPLYPAASLVLEYLRQYAATFNLMKHVNLNHLVDKLEWTGQDWLLEISKGSQVFVDRIIIANGHYRTPRYPDIPGLELWKRDGKVTHSAWYRRPSCIDPKCTALVMGAGPSGRDISQELATVANTVIHCVRGAAASRNGKTLVRGAVLRFLDHNTVEFEDGSIYTGVDVVILATGYQMSIPFLKTAQDLEFSAFPFPAHLVNTSHSIFTLARHIFPLQGDFPAYSAAFIGLPIRVVPFPLMEAQVRAVVSVFRNSSHLDLDREAELIKSRYTSLSSQGLSVSEIAKQWHILNDCKQFEYRNELVEFADADSCWTVEDWVPEIYAMKDTLRNKWATLERNGESGHWLKGVGWGGVHDWLLLMRKLLEND